MKKLPPLNSLRIFLLTSKFDSFTQASGQINLTKGAISQQIKMLENWMGFQLFVRGHEGISLTSQGEELKRVCETAFSLLENEVRTLKDKCYEKLSLNIGCSSSILSYMFLRNQKLINNKLENYQLNYNTRATVNSLLNNDIDIFLSRDRYPKVEGLSESLLFKDEIGVVAEPGYIITPFNGIKICHSLSRKTAWHEWCSVSKKKITIEKELYFETLSLALDAARFGLGITVAPKFIVERDIRRGHLYAPYGFVECATGTWLYYRESSSNNVVNFIEQLKSIICKFTE